MGPSGLGGGVLTGYGGLCGVGATARSQGLGLLAPRRPPSEPNAKPKASGRRENSNLCTNGVQRPTSRTHPRRRRSSSCCSAARWCATPAAPRTLGTRRRTTCQRLREVCLGGVYGGYGRLSWRVYRGFGEVWGGRFFRVRGGFGGRRGYRGLRGVMGAWRQKPTQSSDTNPAAGPTEIPNKTRAHSSGMSFAAASRCMSGITSSPRLAHSSTKLARRGAGRGALGGRWAAANPMPAPPRPPPPLPGPSPTPISTLAAVDISPPRAQC